MSANFDQTRLEWERVAVKIESNTKRLNWISLNWSDALHQEHDSLMKENVRLRKLSDKLLDKILTAA